ncbi:HNH endonuclease [Mucilaginibacter gilvus]|nr:HNH endonuclease [Mucilaginibacter gilvus]
MKDFAVEQISFLENYSIQNILISNDGSRHTLIPQSKRTCRFCNKSSPDVTFNCVAHLIPHSWGNKNLKSDFECDDCNNKFSLFESDFSSLLGIYKTLNNINDQKKTFSSNTIKAKEIVLKSGKTITWIINRNPNEECFKLDVENGVTSAEYYKSAYAPINIYKLFLKIALSCLPREDIGMYDNLINILHKNANQQLQMFARQISIYELSFKVASPRAIVFKRNDTLCKNLMHHIQIYFEDFIYNFPIPLNIFDFNPLWHNNKAIEITFCPPLFFDKLEDSAHCTRGFIDLSRIDKIKEREKFAFSSEPGSFTKLSSWDKVVGVKDNVNLSDVPIDGVVMTESGVEFDVDDLAEIQSIFKKTRKETGTL